jgi:hypothetical protein
VKCNKAQKRQQQGMRAKLTRHDTKKARRNMKKTSCNTKKARRNMKKASCNTKKARRESKVQQGARTARHEV